MWEYTIIALLILVLMDIWAISHLTLFELCRFKYCWTYVVIRIYLHRFWVCSPLIHTISILKWLYRTHTCNNVWGFHLSFIFNSRCGFLFLFSYIAVFVMFLFLLCCSCMCVCVCRYKCMYVQANHVGHQIEWSIQLSPAPAGIWLQPRENLSEN